MPIRIKKTENEDWEPARHKPQLSVALIEGARIYKGRNTAKLLPVVAGVFLSAFLFSCSQDKQAADDADHRVLSQAVDSQTAEQEVPDFIKQHGLFIPKVNITPRQFMDAFAAGELISMPVKELVAWNLSYQTNPDVTRYRDMAPSDRFNRQAYMRVFSHRIEGEVDGRKIRVYLPPDSVLGTSGTKKPYGAVFGISDSERLGSSLIRQMGEEIAFVEGLWGRKLPAGDIDLRLFPIDPKTMFPGLPDRQAGSSLFSRSIIASVFSAPLAFGMGTLAPELTHFYQKPWNILSSEQFAWYATVARRPAELINPFVPAGSSFTDPYHLAVIYGPGADDASAIYDSLDANKGFMPRGTEEKLGAHVLALKPAMQAALSAYLEDPDFWDAAGFNSGMPQFAAVWHLGRLVKFDARYAVSDRGALRTLANSVSSELAKIREERNWVALHSSWPSYFNDPTQFGKIMNRLIARIHTDFPGRYAGPGEDEVAVLQAIGALSRDEIARFLATPADREAVRGLKVYMLTAVRDGVGVECGLSDEELGAVRRAMDEAVKKLGGEIKGRGSREAIPPQSRFKHRKGEGTHDAPPLVLAAVPQAVRRAVRSGLHHRLRRVRMRDFLSVPSVT